MNTGVRRRNEHGCEKMKEKRDQCSEGETLPQSQPLGFERKNRHEKRREQRKKQEDGLQPSYPGPFSRLIRPSGIIRWAYSCNSPGPQGGTHQCQGKTSKKKKGIKKRRVKPPTPTKATYTLIGDVECNGKQEEKKRLASTTLDIYI